MVCRSISTEITSGVTQHWAGPDTAGHSGDLSYLVTTGQDKEPLNLDYLMIGKLPNMFSSRCSSDQYYQKKGLISFRIIKSPECLSPTDLDVHRLEIKFLRVMTPAPHGEQ